jgi:hypothetical protein
MRKLGVVLTVAFLPVAVLPAFTAAGDTRITPLKTWFGSFKDASKRKLAPRDRFLTDAAEFAKLWMEWKPDDKLPDVDFTKDIVLVETEDKGKIDQFILQLDKKGNLAVIVGYTESKSDPALASFGMAQVSRAEIKSIEGRKIDK